MLGNPGSDTLPAGGRRIQAKHQRRAHAGEGGRDESRRREGGSVLTGEAAERPVMRQNMAARWQEARDPHQI
jgi:hypothetical protein